MIFYGRQFIDSQDEKSVISALRSNWLTQGPRVIEFEKIIKEKFDAKYCCAVSNGTAALHLTGIALGWKKRDIILCSPISFLAGSNSVIYSGATPDFVDINDKDYNIDINQLKNKIQFYKKKKRKVKAIIATDFAGNPCDWKNLKKISKRNGIKLINDNCHALGAKYKGHENYGVKYADVVTHSYHPVKNITTGEGGAVLTNNKMIDKKVRLLRSHGVIKNTKRIPWNNEMRYLGFNYRISDIQCALGISQIKKLKKFLKKRDKIANIYSRNFRNYSIFQLQKTEKSSKHAYHLFPLLVNFKKIKISKLKLFKTLQKKKINLQVHYKPIHLQPYYISHYNFKKGQFKNAEDFFNKEISLPIFYNLKFSQAEKIAKLIIKLTGAAKFKKS